MQVRILCQMTLPNSVYYGGCTTRQQRYWWLYNLTAKRFENLGNKYMPGNKPLEVEIDLQPGRYELGCGPRKKGIRRRFALTEENAADDITGVAFLVSMPDEVVINDRWLV